jgi:hypothetical protein
VQQGIVLMLLEQSIGRVYGLGKVLHLGFAIDNAVLNIFTFYYDKLYNHTFLIDLVLEVFLGKPLLGSGCRRAALGVVCVIALGSQLS